MSPERRSGESRQTLAAQYSMAQRPGRALAPLRSVARESGLIDENTQSDERMIVSSEKITSYFFYRTPVFAFRIEQWKHNKGAERQGLFILRLEALCPLSIAC